MNVPNKLTLLRIILMPVTVALFFCRLYLLTAVVFVLAALTDMLDGKIARKRDLVTTFGKFFDPLADKLINLAAMILLCTAYDEPWLKIFLTVTAIAVTARELVVTSFRALASGQGQVIAADKLGKMKTVVQDVAIVMLLVDRFFQKISVIPGLLETANFYFAVVAMALALILTFVSGIHYFTANKAVTERLKEDI